MGLGDAVLTFVSVFVAALLAFYLDGLRERRATRRWVTEYLGFWRSMMEASAAEREENDAVLVRIDTAVDRWLSVAGGGPEPVWSDIDALGVNTSISFTPLLLGSGVGVVPPALLQKLFYADATVPVLRSTSDAVSRLYEAEIRGLVAGRVIELSPVQRNLVTAFQEEFRRLATQLRSYQDQLEGVRAELATAGF